MKRLSLTTLSCLVILMLCVLAGAQPTFARRQRLGLAYHEPEVIATISMGDAPRAVTFSPDGILAFVSHEGDCTVRVVHVSDHTVIDTIVVGEPLPSYNLFGLDVTPDGQYVYVACRTRHVVVPIRISDSTVLPEIPISSQAVGLTITPDGTRVYVAAVGGVDVIQI